MVVLVFRLLPLVFCFLVPSVVVVAVFLHSALLGLLVSVLSFPARSFLICEFHCFASPFCFLLSALCLPFFCFDLFASCFLLAVSRRLLCASPFSFFQKPLNPLPFTGNPKPKTTTLKKTAWWTDACFQALLQRNHAWRERIRSRSELSERVFHAARSQFHRTVRIRLH